MADAKQRFTIKPFRSHVPMDRTDARNTLAVIEHALTEIYHHNASQLSFEELYRNAYNLVLHKHGGLLYDGVVEKMTTHLQEDVVKSSLLGLLLTENYSTTRRPALLVAVASAWKEHVLTLIMIRDILMYMDRSYVTHAKRRGVYDLGLHLWKITVWDHPAICGRVTTLLLAQIAKERGGELMDDRGPIKTLLQMLMDLGAADYSTNVYMAFEQEFLAETAEFYACESLRYLQGSALEYVHQATLRLAEEKERSTALGLPSTTEAPLMNIVCTELIERHAKTLVDMEHCGFGALLMGDDEPPRLADMASMYGLFTRVPSSVDHLRDALADRIKTDGRALMTDQERGTRDPSAFVQGILAMRTKFEQVVAVGMHGEKRAQKRMREAFEDILNIDARAASCLAVYVDELLRNGLRGLGEDAIQEELHRVIIIFRYLADKDVFESFYKQHLAKRLLAGRSVSDEAEKLMVSLLKAECGYQFTTKLEGMFNDMRISKETRDKWKQYNSNHNNNDSASSVSDSSFIGFEIEVDVLTTGYWPSQSVPPCTLPLQVQTAIDQFSTFYLEKHTGRKLSWQTSAGAAELKAVFGGSPLTLRRHELCVTTYQMCILLLFNDADVLTLGQIRNQTHIPDVELRRQLISLCTPRNKILKKGSKGKGITSDDDTFAYNAEYTSKLKRVRIPLVKETSLLPANHHGNGNGNGGAGESMASLAAGGAGGSESGPVRSISGSSGGATTTLLDGSIPVAVEEDRRHLVEAAIVRIMKARKKLKHNDLIAEVTKQLSVRFNASPLFIKKRIESLIEREYLERSDHEHREYMYVA